MSIQTTSFCKLQLLELLVMVKIVGDYQRCHIECWTRPIFNLDQLTKTSRGRPFLDFA